MYALVFYCLLIALASLAGGWIPVVIRLTHRRIALIISAVAGFMLGIGLLLLLPEALAYAETGPVMRYLVAGFLVMFFIERFFCFHHHDVPGRDETPAHGPGCGHDATVNHDHTLTWSGAAVGLTLHSIIAGIALGASIRADGADRHGAGLAMLLMIIMHKPFDSMTLGTLMAIGGWSTKWRHAVNLAFALAVPAGAALFFLGASMQPDQTFVAYALAFSAGTFLCIATSDLLPELQFHHHDRIKLSAALVIGMALAWLIASTHVHDHDHGPKPVDQSEATSKPHEYEHGPDHDH